MISQRQLRVCAGVAVYVSLCVCVCTKQFAIKSLQHTYKQRSTRRAFEIRRFHCLHCVSQIQRHTHTHPQPHPHSHSLMLPWACLPAWGRGGAASSPASCQVSFFKAAEADQMLKIPQVFPFTSILHFRVTFPPLTTPPPPPPLAYFATFCTSFSALAIQMPRNSSQYVFLFCSFLLPVHFFLVTQLRPNELID